MWTCPKCGEKIEDQFDSCWKCAAPPEQTVPSPLTSQQGKQALLFGILFEIALILLSFLLPESWLQIKVRNFFLTTHFPLLLLGDDWLSMLLCLVVGPVLMALVWSLLFYWGLRLASRALARFKISKRQRLVMGYSFGFFCVVVLVWAIMTARPETPIPFTASPEVKSAVDGNTAFALDLYQKLKDQPGNLFFSPYSVSTSLAMTYAGARGGTESEMAKALHFSLPQENLHAAFGALVKRMNKLRRWNRITLATANSLWCQRDYQFTNTFLSLVRDYYGGEARQVDFKRAPETAAKEINAWVERGTQRKIKGVVEPHQFTSYTDLVLCNAIYFKGKWLHQFKVRDTKPAPFHVTANETVTVPMMYQKADFKMAISDDYAVELSELSYSGKELSMVILLPETEQPLPDLEQKLTADNLRAWLEKLDQANLHKTSVWLPRFTTTQSFDLKEELQSLGMTSAFNANADFSGMDGTTNLFISDVFHKAFVEVNEAGTEAAAATVVHVKTKGMADRFVVDHPFLFLIRDNGSGSILFLGRIVDPTK